MDEIVQEWKERWYDGDVKFVPELFDLVNALQKENTQLKTANKGLSGKYVGVFVTYLSLLNEYFPDWKLYCEQEINQLKEALKIE